MQIDEKELVDADVQKNESVFCMPQVPLVNAQNSKADNNSLTRTNVEDPKLDYQEPSWSCLPDPDESPGFSFDVIKNGTVIETINLNKKKAFYTFGRYTNCDFVLEHPSLSRFHAIIQYTNGNLDLKINKKGYYLYDLGSTHGTIMNKNKIEPKTYIYIKSGSCIKFGGSTRLYIFNGPPDDDEKSSDLNINLTHEQMRKLKDRYSKLSLKIKIKRELEEMEQAQEGEPNKTDRYVDWGLNAGEDTDENELQKRMTSGVHDLNAAEELDAYYVSDPKKALKIFFEREGEELNYDVEELGVGRFKCRVRLPVDNDYGEPMYAEANHDGKKKDCTTQCALEACRILDTIGILRHSKEERESHKKKKRNWKSNDYYDSDDDTFLDRTGDIEKKRMKRMEVDGVGGEAVGKRVHTFDSLKKDYVSLVREQQEINDKLDKCKNIVNAVQSDDLDAYIQSLKANATIKLDSITRAKLRRRILDINNELTSVEKLIKHAKPFNFDLAKWKNEIQNLKPSENPVVEDETKAVSSKTEAVPTKPVDKDVSPVVQSVMSVEIKKDKPKPPKSEDTSIKLKLNQKITDKDIDTMSQNENESKLTNYEYPTNDQDYSWWVPPQDQSGDGITRLNEKYGY